MIKAISILVLGIALGAGTVYFVVKKEVSENNAIQQSVTTTIDQKSPSKNKALSSGGLVEDLNSNAETLDDKNESKQDEGSHSYSKVLKADRVTGFTSTKAKVESEDLDSEFKKQEIDYDWAPSKELAIREIVDKHIVGENVWIVTSECRTSLCKLDLGVMAGSSELVTKTLSILEESELDLEESPYSLTRIENNAGYFDVTIFYNKPE